MKIVIFNNLYFPYNKGGAEQYVYNQVKHLEKEQKQVIIITSKPIAYKKVKKEGQIYYLNSLYYNLNRVPKIFRFLWHLKQLLIPQHSLLIKKILLKEKPDLAITHNLLGLSWSIPKLLQSLNIKHQHTLHDIQLLHPSGLLYFGQEKIINNKAAKFYQKLTKKHFKNVSQIISPSKWLLKLHQEKGFFKNSDNKIQEIRKSDFPKIVWPQSLKKILFVGQLEKHKGLLFLIDYIKTQDNLKLSIIGDGSLKGDIKACKNINYLGKLKKKEILEEMKKHDCLIVPSLCYENIPQVIIEASSVGLPTIASNIGGLVELKTVFNLKLFTPNSSQSLEKIIY
jgi:glycosyltransferase involved in cell wall biosynthesis